jgi:hypothetical protein
VSSDAGPEANGAGRSLADYIWALVAGVDAHDPAAGARLRAVAAGRRARIGLDEQVVTVWFDGSALVVAGSDPALAVDGEGRTDGRTVRDILDARIEATAAVLDGRLHIVGEPERVAAMLQIIEILLDVAVRVPELQHLGRELLGTIPSAAADATPATAWYPHELPVGELRLLADLDLLPEQITDGG